MADTVFINGKTYHVQHWDGARMYTKAHGPGTLVDSEGYTYYCTLDHGVISGYCLGVYPGGTWAGVYNAQGLAHGMLVAMYGNGGVALNGWSSGARVSREEGLKASDPRVVKAMAEWRAGMLAQGFTELKPMEWKFTRVNSAATLPLQPLPTVADVHAKADEINKSAKEPIAKAASDNSLRSEQDVKANATTATTTSMTTANISKLNPKQVAELLKVHGASDKAVANFLDNDISGIVLVDGLSDDDLVEIGFSVGVQRRGIKAILNLILPKDDDACLLFDANVVSSSAPSTMH